MPSVTIQARSASVDGKLLKIANDALSAKVSVACNVGRESVTKTGEPVDGKSVPVGQKERVDEASTDQD